MKILFLGTSATFPTKERNHTAILLRYGGEGLLFDCGEGTQRQLRLAGESPMKIKKIFITHWHGDHVLGLPGLIQSMCMNGRKDLLEISGPRGSKETFWAIYKAFGIGAPFKISVHEFEPKGVRKICEGEGYSVSAMRVKHAVPCLAYAFKENDRRKIKKDFVQKYGLQGNPVLNKLQEGMDIVWRSKKFKAEEVTFIKPGKKVAVILDALYEERLAKLAEGADLLICEGTFSNKLRSKVKERGHMTVKQAAKIAKKAGVKELILTHFSQRYKDLSELEKEAKSVFPNVRLAKDFLEVRV